MGEIVFTWLCDKLIDIPRDLELVPQLVTDWSWSEDGTALTFKLREGVTFHDGTPFDAEAVAYNIERSMTLDESRRRSDLASVAGTGVLGDHESRIDLTPPDAALLTEMANRPGVMISPAAARAGLAMVRGRSSRACARRGGRPRPAGRGRLSRRFDARGAGARYDRADADHAGRAGDRRQGVRDDASGSVGGQFHRESGRLVGLPRSLCQPASVRDHGRRHQRCALFQPGGRPSAR
ncbi:ABC transporter substrate-binding protein [Jannaschia rubra]|uniref:ABC transporter substrate-binding protein n=1 Tax=Jannaschia rubra TaxID=282197 RepID=UPI000942083E|nr:ABC transporter substrate-binding protein [Jannaschia rubra]